MDELDAIDALDARALRTIVRSTLAFTGEALCRELARGLADLLGARVALVGEIDPDDPGRVRTRAMWSEGRFAPNIAYDLAGTPCADVANRGECYVTNGVSAAYPTDAMLADLFAQSYFGSVLAHDGAPVGVLAVIHDAPLEDTPTVRAVLSIFATRATAELVRLRAEASERATADELLKRRSALLGLAPRAESDFRSTLRAILETDARTLELERVSYWALTPDRAAIRCEELYTRSTGAYERGALLRAVDCPGYFDALLTSRVIATEDARLDTRTRELASTYFDTTGVTSMLDVPVWHHGELAGVVCHEQVGTRRAWITADEDFAVAIAGTIALALEAGERQRAEERYRLITRASNDVLWDWDIVSGTIDWSDGLGKMFRFAPEEILPTIEWWTAHVHADDAARMQESLDRAFAGEETAWTDEYRFVCGDGSVARVVDRAFMVRDATGRVVRMIGAMLDVTEHRKLEARILVGDRLASVGTLAAGVAHEINNPLAYVMMNVDHAISELERQPIDEEVLVSLREARTGARRVREIVRDLKAFSRRDDEHSGPIEIHPVIESSINMTSNEVRHCARLVRDFHAAPRVDANEARLGQVVINLLLNAAQAIPEGAASANEIRVRTGTDPLGRAVIEVHDTGPGIPREIRQRVFDPFFTTKGVGGGTGLGLSICHSIVSAAGGEITIESAPGAGCVVRVALPASRDRSATNGASMTTSTSRTRARVLVIDDDALLGKGIARMLASECEVEVVSSAREGYERLASGKRVDVVLCDLMMPEMTGMDLYAELARTHPSRLASIVFMTGGAFSPRARDFLDEVPNPRVEKPFQSDELMALIRSIASAAG